MGQQCCIRQVYLGSLRQYRIRRNVLISNHCIPDNTHTNPPANFLAVTNVIFNVCNVSTDPSIDWLTDRLIDWLIDWLIERASECVSRRVSSDLWCECLAVWLSMKSKSFYKLFHKNLSKPWHIVTRYPLSLHQSWFIIEQKGRRFLVKQINKGHLFKTKKITKELTAYA